MQLRQCVKVKCLESDDNDIENYILHHGNSKEELNAYQWLSILRDKRSMFIHVTISRRAKVPVRESKRIERGPERLLIKYEGLSSKSSSGEDSGEDRDKALVLRR